MKKNDLLTIIDNGGATLNSDGAPVTFRNGYQVSRKDCYILDVKNARQILTAVNGLLKTCKRGDFVGLWVNDGKIYIDISEHIKSLKKAIRFGIARKQISIFAWASGDCIAIVK